MNMRGIPVSKRRGSEHLLDLAISPVDEAFKSIAGLPGGETGVPEPQNRTLFLTDEIDSYTALAFNASIYRLSQEGQPIYLIVNCLGGDVDCGLGMYDAITAAQANGAEVVATIRGAAMSMAAIIMQAARIRRMSRNSYFMVHRAWGSVYAHSDIQLESHTKWWKDQQNRMTRLLAERSTMTAEELGKKIAAADWFLNSAQALRYGFVDEVV